MRGKNGWLWLGALASVGGATLWWQHLTMTPLRTQVALLRGQEAEWAQARADQKRLGALQVSAAELESLRLDRTAVERLRAEIDGLRTRLEQASTSTVPENTGPPLSPLPQDGPATVTQAGSHSAPQTWGWGA